MRTVLVGLLVVICLAAIVLPAFLIAPRFQVVARPADRSLPASFNRTPIWLRWSPFGPHAVGWQGVVSALASWVYLYLTSMLVLALFPGRVRLVTDALRLGGWSHRARLLAIGLLAIIASAVLILLARFAFVWILLVIVLTAAILLLTYLGILGVSLVIGGTVRRWAKLSSSPWVEVALGSLVLFALGRIPILGWIAIGILAALGLGAVLATHLGSGEMWSLQGWKAAD